MSKPGQYHKGLVHQYDTSREYNGMRVKRLGAMIMSAVVFSRSVNVSVV